MKALAVALLFLALALAAPPAAAGPISPQHQDVFVPALTACLWQGSWKAVVHTSVVTVWMYSCDSPDT